MQEKGLRMRDICLPVQDLRRLRWDERTVTSGTSGTFPKARQSGSGAQYYYKMSCYDSYRGVYGHECVNEIIASRLMDELGVPHADYRLVHARVLVDGVGHITWITSSPIGIVMVPTLRCCVIRKGRCVWRLCSTTACRSCSPAMATKPARRRLIL